MNLSIKIIVGFKTHHGTARLFGAVVLGLAAIVVLGACTALETAPTSAAKATSMPPPSQNLETGTKTEMEESADAGESRDPVANNGAELQFPIDLPPGFSIRLYAEGLPNARSMALGPDGTLFVGTRTNGAVYAVLDHDQDYVADEVLTLLKGMNMPNGVAVRDGALYLAEVDRVLRYDNVEENLRELPDPAIVNDDFPGERHHGWKFIRFGPDGKLYVPVGAPCNVCEIENSEFGTIMRMNADGSDLEIYAEGIRNSVGFDWDPISGDLWFTDNGQDSLGDDLPPDELNRAFEQGLHFGFPYCHGGSIADPKYGDERSCDEFTAPAQALGPHVAPLGIRFYTGTQFPAEYANQIFVAEHGSSSRSELIGYRIMLVRVENGEALSYEPFAEGWLNDGRPWGRPVDLQVMPDGSLLVSDDFAGSIYRISYAE